MISIAAEFWTRQTAQLVDLSLAEIPDTGIVPTILGKVRKGLGAASVLYVRHDLTDDLGQFFVAGDALPQRYFSDTDCAAIHPALPGLWPKALLYQLEDRVCFQYAAGSAGSVVSVCQVRFHELGTRHFLAVMGDATGSAASPWGADRTAAYQFLAVLAHIQNSFDRARDVTLRDGRRIAVDGITTANGTVKQVAAHLCETWRHLLGAGAVRFWLYNDTLKELDLLNLGCDPEHVPMLKAMANRLPRNASLGGSALLEEKVMRSARPASESRWWSGDPHIKPVLEAWPHLICVPLILNGSQGDSDETTRKLGVLDVHLDDLGSVRQADHRLMFLGSLSAASLERAHLLERRAVLQRLNQIALELFNPKVETSFSTRKEKYLEKLKKVITRFLHANCLSIFEVNDARDEIRCRATTGIEGYPKLDVVTYRAGEGATWAVFERNQPLLVKDVRKLPEYKGRYRELRQVRAQDDHDPFLAVPLPGERGASMGVIRVLERLCVENPNRLQNFSSHDLDLLKLIASQVSPIFQLLRLGADRERLADRVDHQVLQPLQGVVAYCTNLLDGVYGPMDPRIEEKVRYILANARTAAERIKSGHWAKEVKESLAHQIRQAPRVSRSVAKFFIERIIDVQSLRRHDGVAVRLLKETEVDALGHFLLSDYFTQAVGNVLHNAVKYAYPKTRVEVEVRQEGRGLVADVTSCGLPIVPEERERIFEDHTRGMLAETYDKLEGTGQGLFMTRQFLRGLGGDLKLVPSSRAQSVRPPAGFPDAERTTFRMILDEAFP